jgi:hypothetical protein
MSSRNELWDLIEQITLQIDDIIAQGSDTSNTLQEYQIILSFCFCSL